MKTTLKSKIQRIKKKVFKNQSKPRPPLETLEFEWQKGNKTTINQERRKEKIAINWNWNMHAWHGKTIKRINKTIKESHRIHRKKYKKKATLHSQEKKQENNCIKTEKRKKTIKTRNKKLRDKRQETRNEKKTKKKKQETRLTQNKDHNK